MRLRVRSWIAGVLCAIACLPALPASAQDGPLRLRLKERLAERRQGNAQPEADSAQEPLRGPGHYSFSMQHAGLKRLYRVYVPASYVPGTPAPLVVALHGGGGSMEFQADDQRYGLISKAERAGFILLFPNGYSRLQSGKLATWNAGTCCGAARDQQIDDVGFIRALLDRLVRQISIDRGRIYATGMSNGALMAYRLACDMPEVFKAIAPVAGTDNTVDCRPAQPVSVLHIHARDDTHVLFTGGSGMDAHQWAVTQFSSVPDTVAKWRGIDGCQGEARRILEVAGAYCERHASCRNDSEVQLCVTETGGHSWPGATKTRNGPASQAISAADLMWDFFSRH